MSYTKIDWKFRVGQVVTNDNGLKYKVVEVIDKDNVLFVRVPMEGYTPYVKAWRPCMYIKDCERMVLSWGQGHYYTKKEKEDYMAEKEGIAVELEVYQGHVIALYNDAYEVITCEEWEIGQGNMHMMTVAQECCTLREAREFIDSKEDE